MAKTNIKSSMKIAKLAVRWNTYEIKPLSVGNYRNDCQHRFLEWQSCPEDMEAQGLRIEDVMNTII